MKELAFRSVPIQDLGMIPDGRGILQRFGMNHVENHMAKIPSLSESFFHPYRLFWGCVVALLIIWSWGNVTDFFLGRPNVVEEILRVNQIPTDNAPDDLLRVNQKPTDGWLWYCLLISRLLLPAAVYLLVRMEGWEIVATFLREIKGHAGFFFTLIYTIGCRTNIAGDSFRIRGLLLVRENKWESFVKDLL